MMLDFFLKGGNMELTQYFEFTTENGRSFKATITKEDTEGFVGVIEPTNLQYPYDVDNYTKPTKSESVETVFGNLQSKITTVLTKIDPVDTISIVNNNSHTQLISINEQKKLLNSDVEILIDGESV
jgi:hypothetical protein